VGTLEIRLFGILSLQRDGRPLDRLPSRKVKDLLTYLILNRPTPQARETLATALWPDCDGEKARHCLNTTLWRLRAALGQPGEADHPYLRVDALSIGLNPAADIWLDIAEFEAAVQRAQREDEPIRRARDYQDAVDLYQGDLLTECYEDWCLVERERLQRAFVRALGWLMAYYRRARDYDRAIACGERILRCDPLRETTHGDLIRLRLEAGDQAGALRQYEACVDIVRRELGTDVMPETRALLDRIRRPTPVHVIVPSPRPARATLPDFSATAEPSSQLRAAVRLVRQAQEQLLQASTLLNDLVARLDTTGAGTPRWLPKDRLQALAATAGGGQSVAR
jgi:DNA-binding SARP family transcriptional activator